MSAVLEITESFVTDDWLGLYGEKWGRDLVPEAVSHPAKYSRGLIRKIYDHAAEEGWIVRGSSIVDPFGGIAGGALEAMLKGCHWRGLELESRFVRLGWDNIEMWNQKYSRLPGWGSAFLKCGDSRQLALAYPCGDLCVSSPPFTDGGRRDTRPLGGMKSHSIKAKLGGSPPGISYYGASPGQLAELPATDSGFDAAISSPPYSGNYKSDRTQQERDERRGFRQGAGCFRASETYDKTGGNLGTMPAEGFDAAVSSPPYLSETVNKRNGIDATKFKPGTRYGKQSQALAMTNYGESDGQLGEAAPDDFWHASRQILDQLHQVIKPGGHAIFVVKDFVRKKQRVEFGEQWRRLCEAAGFRCLHHHRAQMVERYGAQTDITGETRAVEIHRKSFFRRLAEQKGSPPIDYESVYCFVKD